MAIYEYRCEHDGLFELTLPIGTAPESVPCAACGSPARRVISMPSFRSSSRSAWTAAMDRAQQSRHEPEVVSALPPAGGRRRTVTMTPALRNLPRP